MFTAAARADDGKYDIIIEKNIFSSERKKWVSEPAANKQSAEKMAKKEINELMLLGTVINNDNRYAVLRVKKDAGKEGFKPSMKGDYIQGYLIKEIEEKKVTLQDEAENTEYVLYINDDKKERVAEKTELKPQPPKPRSKKKKLLRLTHKEKAEDQSNNRRFLPTQLMRSKKQWRKIWRWKKHPLRRICLIQLKKP